MKKTLKFMMMALVAIVMSVGFAACSSSDDDNNNTTPEEKEEMTAEATFSYDINEIIANEKKEDPDLLFNSDCVKTTITYYDENNQEVTEEIKDGKFSKTITYKCNKFPTKIGYSINYELDESKIDLSKNYCLIKLEQTPSVKLYKGKNVFKQINDGKDSNTRSYSKVAKVTTMAEFKKFFKKNLPNYSVYYNIQEDGSYKTGRN